MRSVVATFSQKVILASVTIFALMFWPEEMNAQQPDFEIVGLPQNSTLLPTSLGGINLATGSIHLEIPLVSQPDRGGSKFTASLMLNTASWQYLPARGEWPPNWFQPQTSPVVWSFVTSGTPGVAAFDLNFNVCNMPPPPPEGGIYMADDQYTFWYQEPNGTMHTFAGVNTFRNIGQDPTDYPCDAETSSASGYSDDGSGFFISVTNYTDAIVYAPDGTQVSPLVKDHNGNYYSYANISAPCPLGAGNTYPNGFLPITSNVTNMQGITPVTVTCDSGAAGSHIYFTVPNPPGSASPTSTYTATLGTLSVNTPPSTGYAGESFSFPNVIMSISQPDTSQYIFNYDSWGTLQSVTLPTGGVEQFGYSIVAGSLDNATQIRLPSSYTPGAATTNKSFTSQFTGTSSSSDLAFQVTVQNPVEADGSGGGSVVYKYNDLNGSLWNGERDFSGANGTLLRSELFGYQGFFCGFTPNSHTINLFDATGANPITSKSVVSYDNGSVWNNCPGAYTGNSLGARATARPVSVSEYDYGGSTQFEQPIITGPRKTRAIGLPVTRAH